MLQGLTMTGVGDDEFSYSYDPIRHCTFYKEIETKQYGTEVQWKNGGTDLVQVYSINTQ
jgi:hypothetical protein